MDVVVKFLFIKKLLLLVLVLNFDENEDLKDIVNDFMLIFDRDELDNESLLFLVLLFEEIMLILYKDRDMS